MKEIKTYCNLCGEEFDIFDEKENFFIRKRQLGYGTEYDGDSLDMDICCKCMNKIISSCKILPTTVVAAQRKGGEEL